MFHDTMLIRLNKTQISIEIVSSMNVSAVVLRNIIRHYNIL